MKKFLTIFIATSFISASSYATGLFVGADLLQANSRHKAKNLISSSGPTAGEVHDDDRLNYGVNAGARIDVLNLLGSAEIFYDNLNLNSHSFTSASNGTGDKIEIDHRYGAKLNAGFAIAPRITPFLTLGLANVRYNSSSSAGSLARFEMAPLYGIGLLVDLPEGFSVKASYDYQNLNLHSSEVNAKYRSHLGVARVGLVYNF